MKLAIAVALLFISSTVCFAKTASEIRDKCRSETPTDVIWCLGYLSGALDAMDVPIFIQGKPYQAQILGDPTMGQVREMFIHYFDLHPENLDLAAIPVIGLVFTEYHRVKYMPITMKEVTDIKIGH